MSNSAGEKDGIVWPTLRAPSGKRVRAPLPVRSPEPPPMKGEEGKECATSVNELE